MNPEEKRPVGLFFPGRKTRVTMRITTALLLIVLTGFSFLIAIPFHPVAASNDTANLPADSSTSESQLPRTVGASPVPDLHLPKTVVSNIDSLISSGGVVLTSPDDLTLFNMGITLGLRGGSAPHDELMDRSHVLSTWMSWNVEAQSGASWTPLHPISNSFRVIGTNSTGTFVARTVRVGSRSVSGNMTIIYEATSSGSLKWSLGFAPDISGHYSFLFDWHNVSRTIEAPGPPKKVTVQYPESNYTFSWDDVPASMNVTSSSLPTSFFLRIDLGNLANFATTLIDPSLVSSVGESATSAYTFQRKVFYEPTGGYYFVFYDNGHSIVYASSHDGMNWARNQMPSFWPGYNDSASSDPFVYNSGQTVVVAAGQTIQQTFTCPCGPASGTASTVSLNYVVGTITGPNISWQQEPAAISIPRICSTSSSSCQLTLAIRYLSATVSSSNQLAFSFNLYASGPVRSGEGDGLCPSLYDSGTESDIVVAFMGGLWFADCEPDSSSLESIIVPADLQGGVRVIYQFHQSGSTQLKTIAFGSIRSAVGPLTSTADTFVNQQNPTDNYGTNPTLTLSAPLGWEENDVLVNFPLSTPTIPQGAMITGANLTFTSCGSITCAFTGTDYVNTFEPNSDWGENTANFNNRPGNLTSTLSSQWMNFTNYPGQSRLTLFVSNTVRSVVQGTTPQRGLMLRMTPQTSSPNNPGAEIGFYSRETAYAPTLSVSFLCCVSSPRIVEPNENSASGFSAATDSAGGVHLVYSGVRDGNTTYAYLAPGISNWTYTTQVFEGTTCTFIFSSCFDTDPTITLDYSTSTVYVFAVANYPPSFNTPPQILMLKKTPSQSWLDAWHASGGGTLVAQNLGSPSNLGSNLYSLSGTSASWVSLVWTDTSGVFFESIPVQTVWSPFASPSDPWNGYGLAPYGQYFQNLNDYVSASTGMLTLRQTDLNLPGRRLDLNVTRVYTEPYSFLNGIPYDYDSYPWVPLGSGWQLNFPWMSTSAAPSYLHLWNGEGYRIPYNFWLGNTATFSNHQGEQFSLVRNVTGVFLYVVSGAVYTFDPNNGNRLTTMTDATGNNTITFNYSGGHISSIVDTVGRTLLFCIGSNTVRIIQAGGTCTNPTGYVRGVIYNLANGDLTEVTDSAGRNTLFSYDSTGYLITRVTYPTSWFSTYAYSQSRIGTDAVTFRVSSQQVLAPSGPQIKQFSYSYSNAPGGQVNGSTVTEVDGSQTVGYTDYSFSFAGMVRNSSDANHKLIHGEEDLFNPGGQVTTQTVLVGSGSAYGNSLFVKSYTNSYSYDSWGNQIYSKSIIDPTSNWYRETFSPYYNNGVPTGFNRFQETFSQNNGTAADNLWSFPSSSWMVQNGTLNANLSGQQTSKAINDVGVGAIRIRANVYVNGIDSCNTYPPSFGIFAHTGWSLTFTYNANSCSGSQILLLSSTTAQAQTACNFQTGGWYTFELWVQNLQSYGYPIYGDVVNSQGLGCLIQTSIQSRNHFATQTGFGLTAARSSVLFSTITVSTQVGPFSPGQDYIGSSLPQGAPGPNVHGALAGLAEYQNGTGTPPVETLYSYYPWGGLNQATQRSPGSSWLTTSWKYDLSGNPKSVTDAKGNTTSYGYSASYRFAYLTSVNQTLLPSGTLISRRFSYNFTVGTMLSSVDPNGYNTTYQYDILGRPTRINYPYTGSTTFDAYTYNDAANYVNITNENGWKTLQIYDGLGRLSKIDRFLNALSYSNRSYTYNWLNQISSLTDERGNVTSYQYDVLGRITKTTEPNNNVTQVFYNDLNSTVLTQDEQSNYRCNTYDRLGRLLSVIEQSNSTCGVVLLNGRSYVTNYYYDEVSNLRKVTTSTSQSTNYTYDDLNRLIQTNYPDNTATTDAYDSNSNLVTSVDQNGNKTGRSYDSLNRLVNVTYYGNTVSQDNYQYDKNGNLLQLKSQNATIGYTYDARNRLICETYALNNLPSSLISGPCGNGGGGGGSVAAGTLITLADGENMPVQQLRGGMSLLSYNVTTGQFTTSKISSTATVQTDNMLVIRTTAGIPLRTDNATIQKLWVKQSDGTTGWLSVTRLRVGDSLFLAQQQEWTMVTEIDYVPGSFTMYDIYTTAPFDYLANGYLDPPKSPIRPSTPSGTNQAGYSFQYWYGGETLSAVTYDDYSSVYYLYDGLGRLLNTTYGTINGPAYYASFTYYPNDAIKTIKYGNGLVENIALDKLSRPVNMTLSYGTSKPLQLLYSYNKTGTVARITGTVNGANINEQYSYDPIQRLVNPVVTTGGTTTTATYSYDLLGNRKSQTVNQATTSYTYTIANNELANSTLANTPTIYGYNKNGQLLTKSNAQGANWSYKWSVQGTMLSASNSSGVQAYYGYDGLGRRVESKEGSSTIFYAYSGTETLAEGPLNPYTDYIYANGLRISKVTGAMGNTPTVVYYHTDALGSTRLVTSSTRSVVFSDSYQSYGQDNGTPYCSSTCETYKYTGKGYSSATGLYYNYQRWYDPTAGRFISHDPLSGAQSNPQSLNQYLYVTNIPTSLIDPSGMDIHYTDTGLPSADAVAAASLDDTLGRLPQLEVSTAEPITQSFSPAEAASLSETFNSLGVADIEGEQFSSMGQAGAAELDSVAREIPGVENGITGRWTNRIGAAVQRVFGGDAELGGSSWTTANPQSSGEAKILLSLPNEASGDRGTNTASFLAHGYLLPNSDIELGMTPFGATEIIVSNPTAQIIVTGIEPLP